MPHCIIEYAKELEKVVTPSNINNAVYQGALKSELFEYSDIKTRALSFDVHQLGSVKKDFIHVTLKLLSGRNIEERKKLSHLVLHELSQMGLSDVSLTVEVCEIEKGSYAKVVVS